VGAPFANLSQGRAEVYLGSASGLATSPAWTALGDHPYAEFGNSVASAGDVNGDGFSDVIVGASTFTNDVLREGGAFVYLGSASGLADASAWTVGSDQYDSEFGSSVAPAGDVNGDGAGDVIIGAYLFDNTQVDEGRAFVYLGSASCYDADGDGYGSPGNAVCPAGAETDCDDTRDTVYPGATQICDGLNNDCRYPGWPSLVGTNEFDNDGDGFTTCEGDCDDSDSNTYPGAPEVNDAKDNQCPGDSGRGVVDEISGTAGFTDLSDPTAFCWTSQTGATQYEAVRSDDPTFATGCTTSVTSVTCWSDPSNPPSGAGFFYLVRVIAPNVGSWGQDSSGNERTGVCP